MFWPTVMRSALISSMSGQSKAWWHIFHLSIGGSIHLISPRGVSTGHFSLQPSPRPSAFFDALDFILKNSLYNKQAANWVSIAPLYSEKWTDGVVGEDAELSQRCWDPSPFTTLLLALFLGRKCPKGQGGFCIFALRKSEFSKDLKMKLLMPQGLIIRTFIIQRKSLLRSGQ